MIMSLKKIQQKSKNTELIILFLGKEKIQYGVCQAILVNSGNANCFTGEQGLEDAVSCGKLLADHLDAGAILAPTQSGRTAGHLSRFRPGQPIIAYTPNPTTMRRRRSRLGLGNRPFLRALPTPSSTHRWPRSTETRIP